MHVAQNLTSCLGNCGLTVQNITPIRDCRWNRDLLHLDGCKKSCPNKDKYWQLTVVCYRAAHSHNLQLILLTFMPFVLFVCYFYCLIMPVPCKRWAKHEQRGLCYFGGYYMGLPLLEKKRQNTQDPYCQICNANPVYRENAQILSLR